MSRNSGQLPVTEPAFGPDDLISVHQCAEITGLTVLTLRSYSSYRRRSVAEYGPPLVNAPGASLYRYGDVVAWMEGR